MSRAVHKGPLKPGWVKSQEEAAPPKAAIPSFPALPCLRLLSGLSHARRQDVWQPPQLFPCPMSSFLP